MPMYSGHTVPSVVLGGQMYHANKAYISYYRVQARSLLCTPSAYYSSVGEDHSNGIITLESEGD